MVVVVVAAGYFVREQPPVGVTCGWIRQENFLLRSKKVAVSEDLAACVRSSIFTSVYPPCSVVMCIRETSTCICIVSSLCLQN